MPEAENKNYGLKSPPLLVVMLTVGVVLGAVMGITNPRSGAALDEGLSVAWVWICLISWSVCAALAFWFYRQIGGGTAHMDRHNNAIVLIDLGRLQEATEFFTAFEKNRKNEFYYPVYANSLAATLIRNGQSKRAIALLQPLLPRVRGSKLLESLESIILVNIAVSWIYSGDLDSAEATLVQLGVPESAPVHAIRMEIEVTLALRRGQVESALAQLSNNWAFLENASGSHLQKKFRILRAFAEEQCGNSKTDALLDGVRPSRADEYDYICGNWPELSDFLIRNNLKSAATARAGNV